MTNQSGEVEKTKPAKQIVLQGYGKDYSIWDSYVSKRWAYPIEKLGKHRYENWCVFLSPKGRWMAFHNNRYGDIRIVDLNTQEVIVSEFYSNMKEKVYASHTNFSTYVPNFYVTYHKYTSKDGEERDHHFCREICDTETHQETTQQDHEEYTAIWDKAIAESNFFSFPYALNAWTIWAADYEFYVDLIDLREVDDGIIHSMKMDSIIIPRGASNVRDYFDFSADYWMTLGDPDEKGNRKVTGHEKNVTIDIKYMEEKFLYRTEHPAFDIEILSKNEDDTLVRKETKPWEDTKKRMDEFDRKRKEQK